METDRDHFEYHLKEFVGYGYVASGRAGLSTTTPTPNGDQINDVLQIDCTLLRLPEPVSVALKIYVLNGRAVVDLPPQVQPSGRQTFLCDGCDETGHLLPPGIYLIAVATASQAGRAANLVRINIAY